MDKPRTSWRGVWLVLGLVGFGVVMTGVLYVYALRHRGPFHELTVALGEAFPGSAPRIEGGKRKLNEPGPRILRVILKTPSSRDNRRADRALSARLARFLTQREHLAKFDELEIRLYSLPPGAEVSTRTIRLSVAEARDLANNRQAAN